MVNKRVCVSFESAMTLAAVTGSRGMTLQALCSQIVSS